MALLSGSWADADGGELVLGRFADAYLEPIDGELAYVEIPVFLTEPTEVPATVLYRIVMETAALGADFDVRDVQDGLLTFAPGAALANISVTLIGDSIVEPLESFRVELFEARGATIARASVNYWIRDRQWRAPRIFASATSADEGDPMEFEVGGSGLDPAQTISFQTVAGTAVDGIDFTAVSGSLDVSDTVIPTRLAVVDTIADDDDVEETFFLKTSTGTGVQNLTGWRERERITGSPKEGAFSRNLGARILTSGDLVVTVESGATKVYGVDPDTLALTLESTWDTGAPHSSQIALFDDTLVIASNVYERHRGGVGAWGLAAELPPHQGITGSRDWIALLITSGEVSLFHRDALGWQPTGSIEKFGIEGKLTMSGEWLGIGNDLYQRTAEIDPDDGTPVWRFVQKMDSPIIAFDGSQLVTSRYLYVFEPVISGWLFKAVLPESPRDFRADVILGKAGIWDVNAAAITPFRYLVPLPPIDDSAVGGLSQNELVILGDSSIDSAAQNDTGAVLLLEPGNIPATILDPGTGAGLPISSAVGTVDKTSGLLEMTFSANRAANSVIDIEYKIALEADTLSGIVTIPPGQQQVILRRAVDVSGLETGSALPVRLTSDDAKLADPHWGEVSRETLASSISAITATDRGELLIASGTSLLRSSDLQSPIALSDDSLSLETLTASGDYVVATATRNNVPVLLFLEWNGNTYREVTSVSLTDVDPSTQRLTAVDLAGDTVLCSIVTINPNAADAPSGRVMVFSRASGLWTRVQVIEEPADAVGFGRAVAIDPAGTRAVVLSSDEFTGTKGVHIYERGATPGSWSFVETFLPAGFTPATVDLDGDLMVLGNGAAQMPGAVFRWADGTWQRESGLENATSNTDACCEILPNEGGILCSNFLYGSDPGTGLWKLVDQMQPAPGTSPFTGRNVRSAALGDSIYVASGVTLYRFKKEFVRPTIIESTAPEPTDELLVILEDLEEPDGADYQQAMIRVTIPSPDVPLPVSFGYLVAPDTAQPGIDYYDARGTIVFDTNRVAFIPIWIKGDGGTPEPDKAFYIQFYDPKGIVTPERIRVNLLGDLLPELQLGDITVNEGNSPAGTVRIPWRLSFPLLSEQTITLTPERVTAQPPSDFNEGPLTLILPVGVTEGTLELPIVGDTFPEADETFVLRLARDNRVITYTKLTPPADATATGFGSSLATEGRSVVVGAPDSGPGAVFQSSLNTDGSWADLEPLTFPSLPDGARLGSAIAMINGTVIAGAPGANKAFLYDLADGSALELAPPNPPSGQFGAAVATDPSGDLIAVGEPGTAGSGKVHLFQRSVTNQWEHAAAIQAPASADADAFGTSVAFSSSALFIGAPGPAETSTGRCYVFDANGNFMSELSPPGSLSAGARFGSSVAASDSYAFVGAPGLGSIARYRWLESSSEWSPLDTRQKFFNGPEFELGSALAYSQQHSLLVTGAPGDSPTSPHGGGFTIAPEFDDEVVAKWETEQIRLATDFAKRAAEGDRLGAAVAIVDGRIVAGAPGTNGGGAVYVEAVTRITLINDDGSIVSEAPVPLQEARYFVARNDSVDGEDWRLQDYDDSAWDESPGSLGFDRGTTFIGLFETDLQRTLQSRATSLYVRYRFDSPTDATHLLLRAQIDDGAAIYINGTLVASWRAPAPAELSFQSVALDADEDDRESVLLREFPLTLPDGLLVPTGNILAVHAMTGMRNDADFLFVPELVAVTAGTADMTFSDWLAANNLTGQTADADTDGDARSLALEFATGTNPNAADPEPMVVTQSPDGGLLLTLPTGLSGVAYELQISTAADSFDWQTVAHGTPGNWSSAVEGIQVTSSGQVSFSNQETASLRFARLKITLD
ncbi:MAG: hypothetical protein KDN22_19380 [Verrucomicrobiae bacterium]|nr:hypothetical protein [Verrucomicrobiae bacterium]